MDVSWIHNIRRTKRVTYREGATDREAVDKMVFEFLRRASGNRRLLDKRDGHTLSMMRSKSHVIITVERMSEQVLMELSKRQTHLRPDHLPRHRPKYLVDPSDPSLHWMSDDYELNWDARGGRNTQRSVNLSPGAAPETSCLNSRIYHTARVSKSCART